MKPFANAASVAGYRERTEQLVPGLFDLHRMTGLLLAEWAPADAQVLVLGAGGGMELSFLAGMQPGWRFLGIDPSAAMLDLARSVLGEAASRVTFHEGYIDSAPVGKFDAAVCLLTLHFLPEQERLETLRAIASRLKPGAPFVAAHHSFPNEGADQDRWLARNTAFAISSGIPAEQARKSQSALKQRLPVLSPARDESLMRAAGFEDVELFYAAFTFKGWIGHRGS